MRTIRERMEDIRSDRSRGASQLTRQALETLQLASASLPFSTPGDYITALTGIASELSQLRPSMYSINYYMNCFLAEIKYCPLTDDLPSFTARLADDLIRQWEESRNQLIKAGASLISHGDTILTGSYSSTIIASLKQARDEGRNFNLLIANSQEQPGQAAYGANMAAELTEQGIQSTQVEDAEIANYIAMADMVLLGADTVLVNGSVVNGYPSAALAHLANANSVPVYVLCELSKFSDQPAIQAEPGFDLIPSELVTAIIRT